MRSLTILIAASALALAACRSETHGPSVFPVELGNTGPVVINSAGEARAVTTEEIEPRFQPALEALERAVASGDDASARGVLQTLMALEPTRGALELARGYEKILDGRAAVAALSLRLDETYEKPAQGPGLVLVNLVSQSKDGRTLRVTPGPSTLHITFASIDPAGDQSQGTEAFPLDTLGSFEASNDEARTEIARFPVKLAKGAMALRVACDLELRSGSVAEDGRALPAMRMRVATGEVVLLSADLAEKGLSAPGDLAAYVETGQATERGALQIAVRLPRADRASALDLLGKIARDLPRTALANLTGALRWIAPETQLGADVDAWRAYLLDRARERAPNDPLRLPRRGNALSTGS
jgi:hypothetical protein